jgi:hypothetical protein
MLEANKSTGFKSGPAVFKALVEEFGKGASGKPERVALTVELFNDHLKCPGLSENLPDPTKAILKLHKELSSAFRARVASGKTLPEISFGGCKLGRTHAYEKGSKVRNKACEVLKDFTVQTIDCTLSVTKEGKTRDSVRKELVGAFGESGWFLMPNHAYVPFRRP